MLGNFIVGSLHVDYMFRKSHLSGVYFVSACQVVSQFSGCPRFCPEDIAMLALRHLVGTTTIKDFSYIMTT